ncbi:hypothetical protein O1C66_003600 [Vibrio cholerae]|nr:hypothetical protein [Vibrio cholerae]
MVLWFSFGGGVAHTLMRRYNDEVSMNNIDKFDEVVARLFADLYKSFPRKVEVNAFKFLGLPEINIRLDENLSEQQEANCVEADFVLDTIYWLIKSGFVYGEVEYDDNFLSITKRGYDLTLTPKGLELLKLVPESIDSNESLGDKLICVLENGAKDAGGRLVSEALTKIGSFGQLIKSCGEFSW